MPIKRPKRKNPLYKKPLKIDNKLLAALLDAFSNYSFPVLQVKKEKHITSEQQEIRLNVKQKVNHAISSIPYKKRPRRRENYYKKIVEFIPKNTISSALKYRDLFDKGLLKAMKSKHEDS